MDYSVAQLTTVADCDAILAMAAKEKGDLEYRQTGIRRQQTSYADNSVEITTELAAVEAEIEAYTDIISGLPDGQSKKDAQTRLTMQELLLSVWQKLKPTILFVTHDIDEAIFLSNTIYVMTARPGRIQSTLTVPLARPRTVADTASESFRKMKLDVLNLIRNHHG